MSIDIKFYYSFLPIGTVIRTGYKFAPAENTYYLDLGASTEPGVFNYRSISTSKRTAKSTTSLLLKNIEKAKDNFNPEKTEKDEGGEYVKITIVCPEYQDFDCYAAAYLLQYYLKEIACGNEISFDSNRNIYNLLGNYVDAINSGRLILDETQLETPYAIAIVIQDVIKENNKQSDYQEILMDSFKRGIELISCLVQGFENKRRIALSNYENIPRFYLSLHSKDIIPPNCFTEEKQYLRNDHDKYLNDIKSKSTVDRRIKLPYINGDEIEIREVDALFFTSAPSCRLHKHWAKKDKQNSPSKNGFVLTFIPIEDNHSKFHFFPNGEPIKTNRVIISVTQESGVCLYGLGEALEKAELKIEEELIIKRNMNVDEWRSRQDVRYNEEWCINIDPWYDGRHHNYTIVDSPSDHNSLMCIEQIAEITKNFSTPHLKANNTRLLIPFNFSNQKNDSYRLLRELLSSKDSDFEPFSANHYDHYFLKDIEEYLFNPKQELCAFFQINKDKLNSVMQKLNESKNLIFRTNYIKNIERSDFFVHIDKISIYTFKYGIGYLALELKVYLKTNFEVQEFFDYNFNLNDADNAVSIDKIIDLNKAFDHKELFKIIFQQTIHKGIRINKVDLKNNNNEFTLDILNNSPITNAKSENRINIKLDADCFYYSTADLIPNSLYTARMKETSICLSNMLNNPFPIEDEKYFCRPTNFSICYQSTYGTSLVMSGNNEKAKNFLINQFMTNDFFTMLLALHQRHILLKMTSILTSIDMENDSEKFQSLRKDLLEYSIKSKFSHITNNKDGMNNYHRWQSLFENEMIFDKISTKIESYNNYYQDKLSMTIKHDFPLVSYKGNEPYIFVSYSHKDMETVFKDIEYLVNTGYRIWYDEGIDPGNEWPEEVGKALNNCSMFIVFISNNAVNSHNVRNEIGFALSERKSFVAIHIEETNLPVGLKLQMGNIQAIMKYKIREEIFYQKLMNILQPSLKSD